MDLRTSSRTTSIDKLDKMDKIEKMDKLDRIEKLEHEKIKFNIDGLIANHNKSGNESLITRSIA